MLKKRVSKNLRKLFKKSRKLSYKSRKLSNKSKKSLKKPKKPKKVKRKVNPKVGVIQTNADIVQMIVNTYGQAAVEEDAVWTIMVQQRRTNVTIGPRGFDINSGQVYCKQWGQGVGTFRFPMSTWTSYYSYNR